VFSITQIIGL